MDGLEPKRRRLDPDEPRARTAKAGSKRTRRRRTRRSTRFTNAETVLLVKLRRARRHQPTRQLEDRLAEYHKLGEPSKLITRARAPTKKREGGNCWFPRVLLRKEGRKYGSTYQSAMHFAKAGVDIEERVVGCKTHYLASLLALEYRVRVDKVFRHAICEACSFETPLLGDDAEPKKIRDMKAKSNREAEEDLNEALKRLEDAIQKRNEYTLLAPDSSGQDCESAEDVTPAQLTRVSMQTLLVYTYCKQAQHNVKNGLRYHIAELLDQSLAQYPFYKVAPKTLRGYVLQFFKARGDDTIPSFRFDRDGRGNAPGLSLLDTHGIKGKLLAFCLQNIKVLSVERVQQFVNVHILKEKNVLGEFMISDKDIEDAGLKVRGEKARTISTKTAHRWMEKIDCKRAWHKKSYYTDNHESPRAKKQREAYLKHWKATQLYEYCWIQFSREEETKWRDHLVKYMCKRKVGRSRSNEAPEAINEFVASIKPEYVSDEGVHEYHVDQCSFFQELASLNYPEFGGALSIRKPATNPEDRETWPIIVLGEDESVFKSYSFRKGVWSVGGTLPMRPKSEGVGLHVASFVSRTRGWHFDVTNDQLAEINFRRQRRPNYVKPDIAREARKEMGMDPTDPRKRPLTHDSLPFHTFLKVGARREGYFTGAKFAVQLEDTIDCMEVLYPQHRVLIEVDQSAGHGRSSPDALNANNINMLPGANLRKGAFHATRIVDESMLGPHATLKLGDTQHFIFREGEQCLFDCRFSGAELVGKTKGLKQILMERGLWKDGMTLKGPVIDGIVRHDLSAREVLAMQKDFLEEPSILEEIVRARGHLLRVTPICHPEIAGEGVEYNWGMSKRHYGGIEERKRSTTLANKHQLFHVPCTYNRAYRDVCSAFRR